MIIEIIPNLHPLFVHFTVALLITSASLYILSNLFANKYKSELNITAKWCLWLSGVATIATLSAGLYAYYTVAHDSPSHHVMKTHRNLAFVSSLLIFIAIGVSLSNYKKCIFYVLIISSALMVSITAWYGGELVYRHGIGVMSLPNTSVAHEHDGNNPHPHGDEGNKEENHSISDNSEVVNSNESHNHGEAKTHDDEENNEENHSISDNSEVVNSNESHNHSEAKAHENEANIEDSLSGNVIGKVDLDAEISNQNNAVTNNKDGHNHEH